MIKIRDGMGLLASDLEEDFAKLSALDFQLIAKQGEGEAEMLMEPPGLPVGLDPKRSAMVMRFVMEVPADLELDVKTTRGHCAVDGRQADVRVHTGSGEIKFSNIAGAGRAFTGDGGCIVNGHRGDLNLETKNGTVLAYLDELGPNGVEVLVEVGAIRFWMPPGAEFDLEMVAEFGEGKNSYGLPIEEKGRGMKSQGKVAGGGPSVRLWCARGDLSVSPKQRPGN
ncbi:MAG: DUF4097 family beta strand repeat-containing protein [Planctomycetota bacterium]